MNNPFQLIGFTLGILLMVFGTAMLLPALVDFQADHYNAHVFLCSALISWFLGGMLFLTHRSGRHHITIRQTFLLTALSWLAAGFICAIPLWLSDRQIDFTDALFEAVSGITTTGSTVLSGLDSMSHGLLLWRSMTQWIGGIGIIAFAIVLLPILKVGGMQLFHRESSDASDKALPRTGAVIRSLITAYLVLSLLCLGAYKTLGMSMFDAINHMMTTISTGGYSTHDTSFGFFGPSLQVAAMIFMLLGALPFMLYVRALSQHQYDFLRDSQIRALLLIVAAFTFVLTLNVWLGVDINALTALRLALFNIISVITTTGYATTDYLLWGPFATALFFFMTYLGACAGSTSGGIKMIRIIIAAKALSTQFKRLIFPHGVFVITYEGQAVAPRVVYGVLGFLFVYVSANTVLTMALSLTGLDFATAASAAATAIANVGPGIGPVIGPAGNFSTLPDTAKWLLCAGMIVGRLEIMTILVLLSPAFWRK